MKVAMVGGYPLPEKYYDTFAEYAHITRGGVPVHIDRLTHHISQMNDVDLHVITFGNRNEQFKKDNLNIHVLRRTSFTHLSIFIEVILLKRKITQINPDIVHAQGTYFPYSLAASLVKDKYPVVLTVHGVIGEDIKFERVPSYIFGSIISKQIERYALSRIPYIIAVTPQIKELISNWTGAEIHVIPNGIDLDSISRRREPELDKRFDLFYIGLLIKRKGVDSLIKAVSIARRKLPDIRLGIAGSGSQEDQLKTLVKELNLGDNIEFLGFLDEGKKYRYIASADIVVIPSLWEPFGIVLLESMACAKPVIASNIAGIPSIVADGKTGLLCEPGNVEDLAEKILMLVEDRPLREKMGKAGQERAKEFTWDKIAKRTVELYKRIPRAC